ncbi:MAG: polysaccharide biosynthesis tyrosine autokinase [Acidimicrobiales bacterium]
MELGDYLVILRRHMWLILVAVFIAVGSALALSLLQPKVYRASGRLVIVPSQSAFGSADVRVDASVVETEIQILQSEAVQAAVREKLGSAPPITALGVGVTAVIEVRADSTDPKLAAAIVNSYGESYIEVRRKQAVDSVLAAVNEIQQKSDALQAEIDALGARTAVLPGCVGQDPPPNCTERESLQQDRDAKLALQVPFKQRLEELRVDATLRDGGAVMVSRAVPPTAPIRPRPVHNSLLALGLGLVLGVCIAFIAEYIDDSVKGKDDVERAAPSVSVMAMIPKVSGWRMKDEPRAVSITEPKSPAAEAYRTLRTSIQFMGVDRPIRRIQLTSPNASEGKTTTVANLGVALARVGGRVVIVCTDFRRPRIHEFFGLTNTVGFTSVLLGNVALSTAVQQVPGVDGLYLMASGPLPPNPSELLQSARAAEVLDHLQSAFDFMLVDTPPVLPVSDALVVSKRVEATLLVCSEGRTTRKEVSRAMELLRNVDAPVIGTVLNGVSTDSGYGYTYRYYESASLSTNGNGSSVNGKGSGGKKRRSRSAAT